jgi:hypothetical protein
MAHPAEERKLCARLQLYCYAARPDVLSELGCVLDFAKESPARINHRSREATKEHTLDLRASNGATKFTLLGSIDFRADRRS